MFGLFGLIGLVMAASPSGGESNNSPRFGSAMLAGSLALVVMSMRSFRVDVGDSAVVLRRPFRRTTHVPLKDLESADTVYRLVMVTPRRLLALHQRDGSVRVFEELNQRPSKAKEAEGPAGRAASAINAAIQRSREVGPSA